MNFNATESAAIAAAALVEKAGWNDCPDIETILCSTGISPALNGLGKDFHVLQFQGSRIMGIPDELGEMTISLIRGREKGIIAFHGRPHFGEGISMASTVFPVYIAKALQTTGILAITTGCSLSREIHTGDIVVVEDHISFFPTNPLVSSNTGDFPLPKLIGMKEVYSPERCLLLEELCVEQKLNVSKGIYLGVQGPMTETMAEYRMYAGLGGNVIGMTLIPEAIMARALGIPLGAMSLVTAPYPLDSEPVDSLSILETQNRITPSISCIIKEFLNRTTTLTRDGKEF
ncbi:MAG: hypothetical protein CVV64_01905 [Candidatus Wallbacteria bacterium HGW-Wallbacteria-1]|jgi:purine-nucleoside phosphorylase|uniref:purine-nucleoside phosphorylase n=1 Tax=Candidatus Wallbacteria bacterium HGW-Wallbacteria-1 TaxID=2013854 RepID=A0A2N1PV52_9BACT|nr:MAG: hypothetical protein CVV64_01905 [Candidatus Wallbacteria bacterium HGW-Wallbacteria-1]